MTGMLSPDGKLCAVFKLKRAGASRELSSVVKRSVPLEYTRHPRTARWPRRSHRRAHERQVHAFRTPCPSRVNTTCRRRCPALRAPGRPGPEIHLSRFGPSRSLGRRKDAFICERGFARLNSASFGLGCVAADSRVWQYAGAASTAAGVLMVMSVAAC